MGNDNQAEKSEGAVRLRVIRGPVDSLSLYEITDHELDILEEGSPSSTFLNFAILFSSVGVSFLVALLTIAIESIYVFSVFVIVTIVGVGASVVLFVLWYRTRSKVRDLCKRIRARVPTEPVGESEDESSLRDGGTESPPS